MVKTGIQNKVGSLWMTVGTVGVKTVKPGGGSSNRSTGHYECNGIVAKQTYRGVVDVDLVGMADTNNVHITPEKTLWCN